MKVAVVFKELAPSELELVVTSVSNEIDRRHDIYNEESGSWPDIRRSQWTEHTQRLRQLLDDLRA